MTKTEAEKLLKSHRNGSVKPTSAVKEAIDFALHYMSEAKLEDERVKPLQNRCHIYTQGQLCLFCPMECGHRSVNFRGDARDES